MRLNSQGGTITNIMADGSICEDLSTYLDNNNVEIPDIVTRLIAEIMSGKARE